MDTAPAFCLLSCSVHLLAYPYLPLLVWPSFAAWASGLLPKHRQSVRSQYAQDLIERFFMAILDYLPAVVQMFVTVPFAAESAIVIAKRLKVAPAEYIIDTLTFGHPNRAEHVVNGVPVGLLVGSCIGIFGSYFRRSAFRALGPQFTFELSSRKEDKLVTSFPYNIVRHPGYTGGYLTMLGHVIILFSSTSWLRTCVVPWVYHDAEPGSRAVAGVMAASLVITYTTTVFATMARLSKEDEMMRKQFGPAWTAWASRVQSKIVPGVL